MNSEPIFTARSSRTMPPAIIALLLTAANAESTATGSDRRRQFRISRRLLTAVRASGVPLADMAAVLGRSAQSLRTRANEDGAVSASDFNSLTGVSIAQIAAWEASGQIPPPITESDGYVGYPAAALLKRFTSWSTGDDEPDRS